MGTCIVDANQAGSTTTLTAIPTSTVFGQSTTLIAENTSVNANASGNVTFSDGGSALLGCSAMPVVVAGSSLTAQCPTASLAVATHAMTATYSGDANTLGSSNTPALSVVVNKAATTTTITPPGAIVLGTSC